jgi:hypothetical protein
LGTADRRPFRRYTAISTGDVEKEGGVAAEGDSTMAPAPRHGDAVIAGLGLTDEIRAIADLE